MDSSDSEIELTFKRKNSETKLALKLLIDKKSRKVLFGEASKDVVDFIFSLLSLPLGAVTKLLTKEAMVGSIGEVYHSLSKLNTTYILSESSKASLLNPPPASISYNPKTSFLLPPSSPHQDTKGRKFYICSNSNHHYNYGRCPCVSDVKGVTCTRCNSSLNTEATFVFPKSDANVVEVGSDEKGYVKGVVTYSVMDDLTVVPMSTISSITLLNKFQVKDLGSLEERNVSIGFEEGLKLLKASLQTKTVLTDVFLKKYRTS